MWSLPPPSHSTLYDTAISSYQEVDLFSEIRGPDFNSVFGSNNPNVQQPSTSGGRTTGVSLNQYTMGGILTPQAVGTHAQQVQHQQPAKVGLTSDVDSSLALAAANLSMLPTASKAFSSNSWAGKHVCYIVDPLYYNYCVGG